MLLTWNGPTNGPGPRRTLFAARSVVSAASNLARDRYEPHTMGRKA